MVTGIIQCTVAAQPYFPSTVPGLTYVTYELRRLGDSGGLLVSARVTRGARAHSAS